MPAEKRSGGVHVPGLGDDLEVGLGVEQHPQRAANDAVILRQDDPDRFGAGSHARRLGVACLPRNGFDPGFGLRITT